MAGEGVTARWEASYPFLRTDHQTKEKSAWGHNRLSSPAHMTALSSVSASQQGSAVLNNTLQENIPSNYKVIWKVCETLCR